MYVYVCHFHFKCKRRVKQKYYAYRYKLMMVTLCPCSYILLYIFVCLTSLQVLKLGGVFSAFFRSRSFWWTIHLYILGNMMVMYLDKSPICLTSIYTYCRKKSKLWRSQRAKCNIPFLNIYLQFYMHRLQMHNK